MAVGASSALLDCLHVPHLMDGNTLQLLGKKLLVEEACSRVNSFVFMQRLLPLLVLVAAPSALLTLRRPRDIEYLPQPGRGSP